MGLTIILWLMLYSGVTSKRVAPPGPDGLAKTPPMGWMSWERFRCNTDCKKDPDSCIGEKLYMAMADHLAKDGYVAAGYKTISIDDCWEQKKPPRDKDGKLAPDPMRFPSGFKALGDYMHKLNVSFGIYSDAGPRTCAGFPASLGHEDIDAKTFAEWGVDYLKLDGCHNRGEGYAVAYPAMGTALQKSGRDIVYSCSWPAYIGRNESIKPYDAMIAAGCNLWRNYRDISNNFRSLETIIDYWGNWSKFLTTNSGPGHWNDPDQVLCGDDHGGTVMSVDECKTQMSIWSIVAAPLIMSNDLRIVTKEYRELLLNKEVIAVNQDKKGLAGYRISGPGNQQVWARSLADGSVAVALYNKNGGGKPTKISFKFADVHFRQKAAVVRDLWLRKDLGTFSGSFETEVPDHGTVLVKLLPKKVWSSSYV